MASASDGTTKGNFPTREGKYNRIIGRLDALALQSAARLVPSNEVPEAVEKGDLGYRLNEWRKPLVPRPQRV
jgi:hypothetical protein